MKHKIIISLLFLLIGLTQTAFSQPPGKGGMKEQAKGKIEALRKAYITDKLDLSEKEAENFWPIYNAYKQEEKELRATYKRKGTRNSDLTEEEAEALIERMLEAEQKKLDLKKKYLKKMRTAIPAKKVLKLGAVEKSFRAEVMKRMKERREKMREHRGQRPNQNN